MALIFQKKQEITEELIKKIKDSKSLVFVDFTGLESGRTVDLRKKLKENGVSLRVAKKTLLRRALRSLGLGETAEQNIPGQLSIAFGSDEVGAAKAVNSFIKDTKTENLKILGGILEQKFLTNEEVIGLAKIPGREELLAKMVGSIKSPISGFVGVLAGNIRNLISVLNQIKK